MKQNYLDLIELATKELEAYKIDTKEFELINTLFIKKILEEDNANLFIQVKDCKKLYLPVIHAIFLLIYKKNDLQNIKNEFEIGDLIYWEQQNKTYTVTGKNTEQYTLIREYDETDKYGVIEHQEEIAHPRIIDCKDGYIKVSCKIDRRKNFEPLRDLLKKHLNITQLIAYPIYKIAIICCKELITELRQSNLHQAIPYRYLTKNGTEEELLPDIPHP